MMKLGYDDISVAVDLVSKGFNVIGVDIDVNRVEAAVIRYPSWGKIS